MEQIIRSILAEHGKLEVDVSEIGSDEDLYDRGMTSHAVVDVMLGLEDQLDFEFPDRLLKKSTFQTVKNLEEALTEIGVGTGT